MITPTSWAPGSTVLTGIAELTTNDPARGARTSSRRRPVIDAAPMADAAVVVEDGRVVWTGAAAQAPAADHHHDVGGRAVIPGFVDSHTHAVFAGDRSAEFAARMAGRPYAAGGIGTTVAATRAAGDDELAAGTERLLGEMHRQGSTTVEIKSGYGLTVADELRQLRIAGRFTHEVTLLGAHVVAPEYADDPAGYVALVTGEMMVACAPHARWVDVFCERGAFDADQARVVLAAGAAHGLRGRLHANQLGHGPGVRLACELGLAAVDHCTYLDDADIAALHDTGTVATLLPGVEFCTRSPYPDARRLVDARVTVALATDCNPGTCFSSSMPWCVALAVREMGLTWEEALWAATRGGAAALDRADLGQVVAGARADLVVLDAPSASWLAYRPGVDLVHEVLSPAGS